MQAKHFKAEKRFETLPVGRESDPCRRCETAPSESQLKRRELDKEQTMGGREAELRCRSRTGPSPESLTVPGD